MSVILDKIVTLYNERYSIVSTYTLLDTNDAMIRRERLIAITGTLLYLWERRRRELLPPGTRRDPTREGYRR